MIVRVTLLWLTIHVRLVGAAAVVILTIAVLLLWLLLLTAVVIAILTSHIIKHGSIRTIPMVHIGHVVGTVLRILLAVGVGVPITGVAMGLALLRMTSVLLAVVSRQARCRSVVSTTLGILLTQSVLLRTCGGILSLGVGSRRAKGTSDSLSILTMTVTIITVGIAAVVSRVVRLSAGGGRLTRYLVRERFLCLCLSRLRLLLAERIVGLLALTVSVLIRVCRGRLGRGLVGLLESRRQTSRLSLGG